MISHVYIPWRDERSMGKIGRDYLKQKKINNQRTSDPARGADEATDRSDSGSGDDMPPATSGSTDGPDGLIGDIRAKLGDKRNREGIKIAATRILEEALPQIAFWEGNVVKTDVATAILREGLKQGVFEWPQEVFAREAAEILAKHEQDIDETVQDEELKALVHRMFATQELTAALDFQAAAMALKEACEEGFAAQPAEVEIESAAYEARPEQSPVLDADHLLQYAAVMDLEDTVRNILVEHNALNGGKIYLYARHEENARILDRMIKRAAPGLETDTITRAQLQSKRNLNGTEAKEVEGLIEEVRSRNDGKILCLIRGPVANTPDLQDELDKIARVSRDHKFPVIIIGGYDTEQDKGVYSFREAILKAIEIKSQNGKIGLILMLMPARSVTPELEDAYERYLASLRALQAA